MSITWQQRQLVTSFLLTLSLYLSCEAQLKAQAQTSEDTSNNYPDPIALLDGVITARSSIPPFSLKWEVVGLNNVLSYKKIVQVDFDQDRRRYYYYPENPGKPILPDATEDTPDQGLYDGQKIIIYDPSEMLFAEVRHITDQNHYLLFDPRVFGASDEGWSNNVATFMFQTHRNNLDIKTMGYERINNRNVWHVQIMVGDGQPIDYWIDPEHNFQVIRYSHGDPPWRIVTSFYENEQYPWLPTQVIDEYVKGGSKTVFTLLEADEKDFPESHWTLAGMDLPRGTEIYSHLESKSLGYWDGKKISKEFVPRDRKPSRKTQWTFILSLAVLITVIFWIGMLRKQKKQP